MERTAGTRVIADLQGGKTCMQSDLLRNDLVGRDGVGVVLAWNGKQICAGEPGIRAGVSARGFGMAQAAQNGELCAMRFQHGERRR